MELDKSLFGPVSTYVAGYLAADHDSGSWKPEVGVSSGIKVSF